MGLKESKEPKQIITVSERIDEITYESTKYKDHTYKKLGKLGEGGEGSVYLM